MEVVHGTLIPIDPEGDAVEIGTEGRMHITNAIPIAVAGYTTFRRYIYQAIEGYNYVSDVYTIPNGKKLYVTKGYVTGADGGSSAGLYYCPNGGFDLSTELIGGMYFNGGFYETDLDREYTGDGTATIILRLTRRDKGKRWVGAEWWGLVED